MLNDIYNARILKLGREYPADGATCRAGCERDGGIEALRLQGPRST